MEIPSQLMCSTALLWKADLITYIAMSVFVNTLFAREAEDHHSSCRSLLGDL